MSKIKKLSKKIWIFAILSVMAAILLGCTISDATHDADSTLFQQTASVVSDAENECIAPVEFESEEAFVNAVKNGCDVSPDFFMDIEYYYRPKNLTEGALLKRIDVLNTYVMFVYTLDADKNSEDNTKILSYTWYQSFDGGRSKPDAKAYISQYCEGEPIEFEGWENTEYRISSYETSADASDENSETKRIWKVGYVQDGECFESNMPFVIKEELPKYLEMEKVLILQN